MKKYFKVTVLFLALIAVFGVWNPAFGADRVLNLSTLSPMTTSDPQNTVNIQDKMVHFQIYEPLLRQNEQTGEYEPRIAESYSISEDNLSYTFNIRKGVKFHNGEELKASDVVFSLKRAQKTPKIRTYMVGVTDISAPDEYTIVVKLEKPNSAFINNQTNVMIISQKEVESQGDEFGTKLNLAGTGPYFFTHLQHDVEWTCEAFPDYYLGQAPIKKVHYVPISEASAGLIAFESGELDWYIAPIANWSMLTANPNFKTELVPANHISFINVNYLHPPLDDDNIRLAIAYAVDKEAMNIACFDGLAKIADFMVQPQNTGAPTEGVVYNYDPEKAKEYVKKSAYPNGTHVGTINCSAGGYFEKMAQVLHSNLADIGLSSEINRLDSGTNMELARNQKFDLITTGFGPNGDYESVRRYSHTDAVGSFYVKYEGDKFDYETMNALWDAGVATSDLAERKKIYRQLSDWIANTATALPVFHKVQPYVWTTALNIPVNYPNYPQIREWSWAE